MVVVFFAGKTDVGLPPDDVREKSFFMKSTLSADDSDRPHISHERFHLVETSCSHGVNVPSRWQRQKSHQSRKLYGDHVFSNRRPNRNVRASSITRGGYAR